MMASSGSQILLADNTISDTLLYLAGDQESLSSYHSYNNSSYYNLNLSFCLYIGHRTASSHWELEFVPKIYWELGLGTPFMIVICERTPLAKC